MRSRGEAPDSRAEPTAEAEGYRRASLAQAERFYAEVLSDLLKARVRFLVGGGFAVNAYTGARRPTKDLDIFTTADELPRLLGCLQQGGRTASMVDERWIGKIHHGANFVDIIFGSSNGLVPVQAQWFKYVREACVLGHSVPLISPTELIWSKVFVQKRQRHDASDIANVILIQRNDIDWHRLVAYVDKHWEVLLCHVLSFRWIYPSERDAIPEWLLDELLDRLERQREHAAPGARICRGRLLSSSDYRIAVEKWGFLDAIGEHGNDR
ncbi:nucleotidyltransferase domain-containing protein [Bradyrhizobium sp. ORS 86]|uniref:nucleotidyltransferase domain-containing protein n=1 Tax=Bradyrhizobium sp. ORS 86 TaxID=1685970 RepID=UPI00388F9213